MNKLLFLKASPRGDRSYSGRVAEAFVDACRERNERLEVKVKDLFAANLPPFDSSAAGGKYAIMQGREAEIDEQAAWMAVQQVVAEFAAFDCYVIATPMWNFGIPYILKQYIDIIVQPGLTFKYEDGAYEGLMKGRKAFIAFARGGDYSDPEAEAMCDFQVRYLRHILGFIGVTEVNAVGVQPTVQGGPDVADRKLEEAVAQARAAAQSF